MFRPRWRTLYRRDAVRSCWHRNGPREAINVAEAKTRGSGTEARPVSGKTGATGKPAKAVKGDPRVRRTRDALGDALVALMQEKEFASIRVQDVLDRAGVGRSTFYEHFKDKDDLFD